MLIGTVNVEEPAVVLAPVAGVTDTPFRMIAREEGCALVFTEMINAHGLVYRNQRTLDMAAVQEAERPVAVQIFGSDPGVMAEATAILLEKAHPDIIDINMGCPVPKVVKKGEGSALMKDPELAAKITRRVVQAAQGTPVTVKMRSGWDRYNINATGVAKAAEAEGAAAVTVHGRTRSQLFKGSADWGIIKTVKERLLIPVIGNGDVDGPEAAVRMISETGCDGVMIGRGCLGNPWVFRRCRQRLRGEAVDPPPRPAEKVRFALEHLDLALALQDKRRVIPRMRKVVGWYLKGLPDSAAIRRKVISEATGEGMRAILERYRDRLDSVKGL